MVIGYCKKCRDEKRAHSVNSVMRCYECGATVEHVREPETIRSHPVAPVTGNWNDEDDFDFDLPPEDSAKKRPMKRYDADQVFVYLNGQKLEVRDIQVEKDPALLGSEEFYVGGDG